MAKPKKPKFSKLDQRIYNSIGPYFYSTNKASAKIAVKNILKNKSYWQEDTADGLKYQDESGRQTQDPYFNEMFQYALGKGDMKDLEYFEESPYKPSISKEDNAKYIRLKGLDKKAFLEKHRSFLRDGEANNLPIVSSGLQTINPEVNPDYTFGNLTAGKGTDEQGDYVSIYDKWDFANKQANRFLDRKPEMYDKIYYDNEYKYLDQTQPGRESFNIPTQNNNRMASNNLKEYGLGGWIKDNKQGVMGGLTAAAGVGAMFIPGMQGVGAGLISQGVGGIGGEIQQDAQANALEALQQPIGNAGLPQQQNMPTFAMGGMTPYGDVPVELENDEVFKKPGDTKIHEVDGKYHSQGGEPYKLPVGTEVLGKSINPLTKKMFKQDGMKLKKEQDRILSRGSKPGTIGKRSDDMNLKRIMNEYNGLFLAQEKMNDDMVNNKMPDGGKVSKAQQRRADANAARNESLQTFNPEVPMFGDTIPLPDYEAPGYMTQNPALHLTKNDVFSRTPYLKDGSVLDPHLSKNDPDGSVQAHYAKLYKNAKTKYDKYRVARAFSESRFLGEEYREESPDNKMLKKNKIDALSYAKGGVVKMPLGGLAGMMNNLGNVYQDYQNQPTQGFQNAQMPVTGGDNTSISYGGVGLNGVHTPTASKAYNGGASDFMNYTLPSMDFGKVANTAAQLAPMAYNLIQGMQPAEQLNASDYYNPQYNQSINLMANRRFDVNPLLDANRNATAIGRYNLQNSGASAGQQYAGIQGLAAQRMRADSAAYAQKNNVDNQYLGEEAQVRAGLGGQKAATKLNIAGINQQSDAAGRSYLGQGFSDLSEYAQIQQLMANQQGRDADLAGLYPDMFGSVYPYMSGAQNVINKYKQG